MKQVEKWKPPFCHGRVLPPRPCRSQWCFDGIFSDHAGAWRHKAIHGIEVLKVDKDGTGNGCMYMRANQEMASASGETDTLESSVS